MLQAAAPSAVERRRWQVIALLADQVPEAEIIAATGYRLRTIREIARRYRDGGAAALVDRRTQSPGAPSLLTAALRQELWHALQSPPSDGEYWTGPKVAQWLAARIGLPVYRQRGWEYLRHLQGTTEPRIDDEYHA